MPSSTVSSSTPGMNAANIVGSRCPPVGVIAWPAGTIRGPSIQPRVDGLAQRDVEQVAAGLDEQSEVAHGGEAGAQRAAGVAHRTQHPGRRIVLNLGQAGVFAPAAHQEVDLHVHQAGQQDGVAEVDDVEPSDFTTQADDAVAVDLHDAGPDDLAGVDVDVDPPP